MFLTVGTLSKVSNNSALCVLVVMTGNVKTISDVKGANREGSFSVGCCGE